jgi:hypothetical protein
MSQCGTKIRIPTVEIPPAAAAPAAQPRFRRSRWQLRPAGRSRSISPGSKPGLPKQKPRAALVAVKKSGGSGRTVGILVMLALLILAGAGGWLILKNQPIYAAAVTGTHAPAGQGISVSVPWATVNVEQSRQPPVVEYFKRHQTAILSNILKIEIAASINGLEIRALPLEGTEIIGVDPYGTPDIKKFLLANETAWDATRRQVLAQFGKNLCDNVSMLSSRAAKSRTSPTTAMSWL